VLTLPVLAALRAQFPEAAVDVLGYPRVAKLAAVGGLAEEVHPIESRGMAQMFAQGGAIPDEVAALFRRYSLIVSFLFDPDAIFQTNVAACSGAQFIAGPHRPPADGAEHATAILLKPLERLAIFGADPMPRLRLRPEASPPPTEAPPRLQWVAVHPGSGSEQKNWPERHWTECLRKLAETGALRLLMVGGEAESHRLHRLASLWPADRIELAVSQPLEHLVYRLSRCQAFLGHDSGITHLAAALGLPTLALWGPTSQTVWRPLGERARVLHAPGGLPTLQPETVTAALLGLLAAAERSQSG
jgi:ADP-heptose:LPS heptosyltransferase